MRRAYQRVVELANERGYRQFECAGFSIIHVQQDAPARLLPGAAGRSSPMK